MDLFGRKRIAELERANANLNRRLQDWEDKWQDIMKLTRALTLQQSGMARVIAKLDPMYGRSEFDPDRIAESKKLEEEIISKMLAEHAAANKFSGL